MFDLIVSILVWFYSLWPSYGFAVVMLTMTVMVVVTPLTLKSTRSMLQMQRLQPELKSIQAKHKDDRQKMNEELMAFYQENGINPLGGCLPLVIQLPVFLVLFRVVQGITRHTTRVGTQLGWTGGRIGAGATPDVTPIDKTQRPFDPENLSADSDMYSDLTGAGRAFEDRPTEMVSWGFDLSRSAQDVLGESVISVFPYLVMIVIVLVSSVYQQRQIRGRSSGAQVNPQQEMIMKILPFMLPVFSFTMPAALVVYFVVSNIYRIGQQAYITHSLYKGEDSLGAQAVKSRQAGASKAKDGGSGSSGTKRTTEKKGSPTPKRGEQPRAAKNSKNQKSKSASARKGGGKGTGAGRTGNAPSRQHRGGGRTTDPGSPQHKKRKR